MLWTGEVFHYLTSAEVENWRSGGPICSTSDVNLLALSRCSRWYCVTGRKCERGGHTMRKIRKKPKGSPELALCNNSLLWEKNHSCETQPTLQKSAFISSRMVPPWPNPLYRGSTSERFTVGYCRHIGEHAPNPSTAVGQTIAVAITQPSVSRLICPAHLALQPIDLYLCQRWLSVKLVHEGRGGFKPRGRWRCSLASVPFSKAKDIMFSTWKRKVTNNSWEIALLANSENRTPIPEHKSPVTLAIMEK